VNVVSLVKSDLLDLRVLEDPVEILVFQVLTVKRVKLEMMDLLENLVHKVYKVLLVLEVLLASLVARETVVILVFLELRANLVKKV